METLGTISGDPTHAFYQLTQERLESHFLCDHSLLGRFDEVNTYLSRDGGSSFSLIMNGSHVFQHTNFGSFIIMTPTDHTAAEVR